MTVFQLGRAAACAPPHPPGLSRRIMSLYYTFHFRGQSCRLSGYFFQKFFQTPQTGIDRAGDSALMSAFRFCNFRLAHTEKKVCVNPVPLFFRALRLFLVFLLFSPVFLISSPVYLEELLSFLVSPQSFSLSWCPPDFSRALLFFLVFLIPVTRSS